ncbi:amidase [Phytoactinopolyspora mesophila]|uniref:Amidase n=1 Tax=Phytoactinopolyspora mesophila TaxID=2650750 RepID=A0A7K3M9U7_9ACTN|nr:amidase [Phytoactinopolyspora mesophila]NDL60069.1 amidase [Phytoactinopolyspora mesophila]
MTPAHMPSIVDLGRSLRRRATTSSALVAESLRRAHELNPTLNAFALIDEEGALEAARTADRELVSGIDRGPLHGIPVAVKDLIDMAGLPTTCGSASSFGATARVDAEVVKRLRLGGAVIVGKTVLHEFAYGATGDRSVHGASRNPRDPSRMSGGSNGGSTVAVTSGVVPLAVGTDTVGSVRVPAALCGVVGLKPAYGAIPTTGVYPLAPSLDHVGLFAATSDDVLIGYKVLAAGQLRVLPESEGRLSVGWIPPGAIGVTEPRIDDLTHDLVVSAGLIVDTVEGFPGWRREQSLFDVVSTIQSREAYQVHEPHLDGDRDQIDTEVLARLDRGREVSAGEYAQADAARSELRATVEELLKVHDLLALPTVPTVAPPVGARRVTVAGAQLEVRSALLSLTNLWNLAGVPAMSVPAGEIGGLPFAVQLVTATGRESLMFAAARALELVR